MRSRNVCGIALMRSQYPWGIPLTLFRGPCPPEEADQTCLDYQRASSCIYFADVSTAVLTLGA